MIEQEEFNKRLTEFEVNNAFTKKYLLLKGK